MTGTAAHFIASILDKAAVKRHAPDGFAFVRCQ
jgi:hypothetical protein